MTIEVYKVSGRDWAWRIVAGNNAVVGQCTRPGRRGRILAQARKIAVGCDTVISEADPA